MVRSWSGLVAIVLTCVAALVLTACAGPGQPPTKADLLFPIPYIFKQQGVRTHPPVDGETRGSESPATRR